MNKLTSRQGLLAWVLLILVSIIWGSSFILIKKGLQVFSPAEVGTLRIFIACLVLIPFSFKAFSKVEKNKWPILLFVGGIGSFVPALLFSFAQTRLDSALAGVMNSFTPLFVILFGVLFFKSKLSLSSFLGIVIGFLGCVFIIFGGANFNLSGVNYYALLILLATIMYATNVNIIKTFLPNIKALHVTSISFALISPFCAIFLFLGTDFFQSISMEKNFLFGLGYVLILGAVNTALAMFIFNNLIKIASPVFASSCTYLIPIVSVFWGLIDGESLNIYEYLGIVIILGGVYLANRK
ncbi:MAG: DMT family transporter [Reichenbachiella sp.]